MPRSYNSGADRALAAGMISSGECTISRLLAGGSQTMTSQVLRLSYFTALKSETITKVKYYSVGAAGATPSLVRYGVYLEDPTTLDIALIASIANDTAIFAAGNTGYQRTLSSSFGKLAGRRYAVGLLVVTAAAAPTTVGITSTPSLFSGLAPQMGASITGQADLPASVTAATLAGNPAASMGYAELLP